jgi:hypothetical protein
MSENGKGDKQRPLSIDKETFDNNWDSIFNKKKEDTECHYSGLPSVNAYEKKENE